MFDFLYQLTDMQLFSLLSLLLISISVFALFMVRRFIPLKLRYHDNPVMGNVSSLIGVIYGVLAGLTALYLINNLSATSDSVQHEANASAGIYRDSKWLDDPAKTVIQHDLKSYLEQTISVEWPLMSIGKKISNAGDLLIEKMSDELKQTYLATHSESFLFRDTLENLKDLYDSRQLRISNSYNELSSEIWLVIFIGSILTIAINVLFGLNFNLHIFTVVATALMTASMIFLLITLDRPFQGDFSVDPGPLQAVLDLMYADAKVLHS